MEHKIKIRLVTRTYESVNPDDIIGAFRNEEGKFFLRWNSDGKEKIRQVTKGSYEEVVKYFEGRK